MQGTADRIRAAALAEFVTNGYAATSMARIRNHAAVSNGSLFHFFPRKADLAAGVLTEGMRDCQDAVLAALDTTAEQGVRAGVRALLAWVDKHTEMARFVFTDAPDEVLLAAEPTLAAHNRRYVHHIATWLTDRDLLRDRPFEVVHARIAAYLGERSQRLAIAQYVARLASKAKLTGVELPTPGDLRVH